MSYMFLTQTNQHNLIHARCSLDDIRSMNKWISLTIHLTDENLTNISS